VILPDVNVLLHAFRVESSQHAPAIQWLQSIVASDSAFGISPHVLAAVARVSTNRRIYPEPSGIEEALAFADFLLDQPHCHVIEPGERHWTIFKHVCHETRSTGDLVPDAWYAALAIEHGCEWITLDRDYARFPGLRWRSPF
jgi:toxin-antitoxin system PIN domain toxin